MNADNSDMEITLPLLQTIAEQANVTQRNLSQKLGLALGLTNNYLKRCAKKGLIKIEQAPANRYLYYLTPQGFSEKSRLTAQYLSHSFQYYRKVKKESEAFVELFKQNSYQKIAVIGENELSEIVLLVASGTNLLMRVFHEVQEDDLQDFDAAIVCDTHEPQAAYKKLLNQFSFDRIYFYKILGVVEEQ